MERIRKYFPGLSETQIAQYQALMQLYSEWNEKVNLISRNDLVHLYERHVLFSLALCRIIQFKPATELIDIGTGGGFPGIPLAIFFPDCRFTLLDSIRKKVQAVGEISSALKLENVAVHCGRSEDFKGQYDFVLGRAVTSLSPFVKQTRHLIRRGGINTLDNGILYLKGGDIKEEAGNIHGSLTTWNISQWFRESFFETKLIIHITL